MMRLKLLCATACCAVLFAAVASADDHGRGRSDNHNWNDRGNWHQSDGRWSDNRWNNSGRWNNTRYVPVARPVYVRPYYPGYRGGYYPAPVYYGPAPVYYAPAPLPVYPYYPYYGGYGGYNRPSVTGSIIFSFPFHF
jgi:hypothetical protein